MTEILLKIKVHPDSSKNSCIQKSVDAYEIWVRAPAQRGLANQAALNLLAQTLDKKASQLFIVRGARTPNKIVRVLGSSENS